MTTLWAAARRDSLALSSCQPETDNNSSVVVVTCLMWSGFGIVGYHISRRFSTLDSRGGCDDGVSSASSSMILVWSERQMPVEVSADGERNAGHPGGVDGGRRADDRRAVLPLHDPSAHGWTHSPLRQKEFPSRRSTYPSSLFSYFSLLNGVSADRSQSIRALITNCFVFLQHFLL